MTVAPSVAAFWCTAVNPADWQADIYEYIRSVVSLQSNLGIERMCHLAGVSRAGFYRHLRASDNHEEEMHVKSEIQRITLEHRG